MRHCKLYTGNVTSPVSISPFLEISHKNIDLDADNNFTLSWRLNVINTSCESDNNMISITSTTLCMNTVSQEHLSGSDVNNVTLPLSFFTDTISGETNVIDISLMDDLQEVCPGLTLKQPVRFNREFHTLLFVLCIHACSLTHSFLLSVDHIEIIQVPLESGDCRSYCINISSSTFILAISNTPRDILCPVYIEKGKNCYNHSRCNGFDEAFQWPFFSICRNPDNDSLMCFTNITKEYDGIKLFFISANRHNCEFTPSSNLYFRALELQVDGKLLCYTSATIVDVLGI